MSKSIKFRNNLFLDSSSIVHNRTSLKSIINSYNNRKFLEWKTISSTNFNSNEFYTPGLYMLAGRYSNAPYSTDLYGVAMILTNDGGIWRKTDNGSWLWQIVFTTGGAIYQRIGINGTSPESWRQLH